MRFTFETDYNQKTLSVMAKCIRKTARKSKSKRSHIFGWIIAVLALMLSLSSAEDGFSVDFRKIVTWAAVAAIVFALIFEDRLNGYFAKKRMLNGTETAVAVFDTEKSDTFVSETSVGKSEFSYDKIVYVSETDDYFVFIFSANHAQIYDKNRLSGGSADEFRSFISEKTGGPVMFIK